MGDQYDKNLKHNYQRYLSEKNFGHPQVKVHSLLPSKRQEEVGRETILNDITGIDFKDPEKGWRYGYVPHDWPDQVRMTTSKHPWHEKFIRIDGCSLVNRDLEDEEFIKIEQKNNHEFMEAFKRNYFKETEGFGLESCEEFNKNILDPIGTHLKENTSKEENLEPSSFTHTEMTEKGSLELNQPDDLNQSSTDDEGNGSEEFNYKREKAKMIFKRSYPKDLGINIPNFQIPIQRETEQHFENQSKIAHQFNAQETEKAKNEIKEPLNFHLLIPFDDEVPTRSTIGEKEHELDEKKCVEIPGKASTSLEGFENESKKKKDKEPPKTAALSPEDFENTPNKEKNQDLPKKINVSIKDLEKRYEWMKGKGRAVWDQIDERFFSHQDRYVSEGLSSTKCTDVQEKPKYEAGITNSEMDLFSFINLDDGNSVQAINTTSQVTYMPQVQIDINLLEEIDWAQYHLQCWTREFPKALDNGKKVDPFFSKNLEMFSLKLSLTPKAPNEKDRQLFKDFLVDIFNK
ncbi:hypothetical protein G9A89_019869 [Geosiphon pyriformis]|nr:hypothetical protein G9A89_019869 [Geosiphon pyriformis]